MKYDIKITISKHEKRKKNKNQMKHAYYDFNIDGDLESENIGILLSSIKEALTEGQKLMNKQLKKLK